MSYAAMMQGSEYERRRMAALDALDAKERAERILRMGKKVDRHCPYDETRLREYKLEKDKHICPCCWTTFNI